MSPWSWMNRALGPKHPVLRQNKKYFQRFNQRRPVQEYDLVCFDTELTGLDMRQDEIVAIGAVRIREMRIVVGDNFFSYVHPQRDLPKNSTLIHRITPQVIEKAPAPEEILPDFVEFCAGALLIGHAVQIDMAFLNKALRKHLGGIMRNPCMDSLGLAQAHFEYKRRENQGPLGTMATFNLSYLAHLYELPLFEPHDALEDAMQAAYLTLFLVEELKRLGYVTLKDFYRAAQRGTSIV